MSSEWQTYRLQDVGRIITGKTPKSGISDYEGTDVPFVSPPDFSGSKWISRTVRSISKAGALSVKGSVIPARSVLVTCIGSDMGKAAIASSTCVTNQQINAVLVDESKFCPEFLYYNLSIRKNEILGLAGGSAQPILNKTAFGQIVFDAPDLEEQRLIATTLRPFDDRITLLRETNATLEAIARALFKSWFVDFDPVRAKMEGRAPEGMDEATAALFSDGFEESELGLVPRGWRIGKLEDLLILQRGFDLPASERVPGNYPIIAASGPSGTHYKPMAKAPGVVTGRSGVLGRVFLELEDYWPLNTTLWVKEFRAAPPCYAYEILRLLDFTSFNAGSAVPTLNRNHIHSLPYLIPPRACLDAYESLAMTFHKRVRENQEQAKTLVVLRDTLLPRLISGQLRLPEAEALIA
ncbi:restriction endonuclease subunit S [Chromobacterium amazonense]|uniref:restriction endonuclease subunit S n=1 Tax=Chromobacterium amazonense TaxID=1382803 RepID=UPI0031F6E2AC